MAGGWVKSLQCKSRAYDDVLRPNPVKLPLISPATGSGGGGIASCRNSFQGLKDVIPKSQSKPPLSKPKPKSKPKQLDLPPPPPSCQQKQAANRRSRSSFSGGRNQSWTKTTMTTTTTTTTGSNSNGNKPKSLLQNYVNSASILFPTLSELQEGHPSRNVVEIIFRTRWGPKGFSGRVDMVFKIHNLPKTLSRFEDYRDLVKTRAISLEHATSKTTQTETTAVDSLVRCVADGNEMMRFHCLGPSTSGLVDAAVAGIWAIDGAKPPTPAGVCTFDGSGTAHDSAGGGKGRRAMVVCRVIAGRVARRAGLRSLTGGFESVAGENGQLIVFDSRAVLPCFLVIYRL